MKRAAHHHKALIADILTNSFDDNQSVNFVVKQDSKRKKRIRRLMEYAIKVCEKFGDVWISDDEQACALTLLPRKKKTTLTTLMWDATLTLSVIGISNIGRVLGRESIVKLFYPKKPLHYLYLWFIGVQQEMQGKGKGSQLLQEIIAKAETEGIPIYLETSTQRNILWYRRHGFESYQTLNVPYTLHMMRRIA